MFCFLLWITASLRGNAAEFLHFSVVPDLKPGLVSVAGSFLTKKLNIQANSTRPNELRAPGLNSASWLCHLVHWCLLEMHFPWALLTHERALISWCVLCTLNFTSRSCFGQHLLFPVPALLQPWYCFTWIWRPCVFVPSTDNVISVKNHHVLFVLILFPCAWDVLGVIFTAGWRSLTGHWIFICWIYKEGTDCSYHD